MRRANADLESDERPEASDEGVRSNGPRWYSSAMKTHIFKSCLIIVLLWSVQCALGALADYGDSVHEGDPVTYAVLFGRWWSAHALMMVFSCAGYAFFTRYPALVANPRAVALGYLVVLLAALPLQMVFIGLHELLKADAQINMASLADSTKASTGFRVFLKFVWLTFTYIAVVGVCGWRERRMREDAWVQAHHDNLQLRLDFEQQRLRSLRDQLEPHFLFNALNAISALVRTDDKRVALAAIGNLSELLRYALQASEHDHVTLAEERKFVVDYLALQKLRYGVRLQVHIDDCAEAQLPPLLLQPLVENALRHDLECHDGVSDIRLAFSGDDKRLTIRICNPCGGERPANPGLGLGLPHTRARLQLAYGDDATMSVETREGRFIVQIDMPRAA